MRGQAARRTVIHFGFDYDYEGWKVFPTTPPSVARYPPGATIGWHRDAPMFGTPVVGVSLLAPCIMKFRRKAGESYEVFKQTLDPRSFYVLGHDVRSQWQHSIPPTKAERFSITMRTLRKR
jgi:alkylated DNA repair protein (DNA oxidative demethylase)